MPSEIGLWRVDGDPVRVTTTAMPLESRLEQLIEKEPSILGQKLLLIGRQVPTAHGTFIDLLAMDDEGGLHVVELKRDRTPREVVAQCLDYASWVQGLSNAEVRQVFTAYRPGEELDVAFFRAFDSPVPDELNSSHQLLVVASRVDAATERIVTYLSTGYGVPINVAFFNYFDDGGRAYLARTWLLDEATTAPSTSGTATRGSREEWNQRDWYVSFGEESGVRSWEDAVQYGFVSAGGGEWFSRTLKNLPVGARIFVYIPGGVGYVGVGEVSGPATTFDEAQVLVDGGSRPLHEQSLRAAYRHEAAAGQDTHEYVVPVLWSRCVPRAEAVRRVGLFANQNSACKLRHSFTIETVASAFGLGD